MVLAQEGITAGLLLLLQGKQNWKRKKEKIFEKVMPGMGGKHYLKQDEDKF